VSASPKNKMPPKSAITGTVSCIIAACVGLRAGKTEYQSA